MPKLKQSHINIKTNTLSKLGNNKNITGQHNMNGAQQVTTINNPLTNNKH